MIGNVGEKPPGSAVVAGPAGSSDAGNTAQWLREMEQAEFADWFNPEKEGTHPAAGSGSPSDMNRPSPDAAGPAGDLHGQATPARADYFRDATGTGAVPTRKPAGASAQTTKSSLNFGVATAGATGADVSTVGTTVRSSGALLDTGYPGSTLQHGVNNAVESAESLAQGAVVPPLIVPFGLQSFASTSGPESPGSTGQVKSSQEGCGSTGPQGAAAGAIALPLAGWSNDGAGASWQRQVTHAYLGPDGVTIWLRDTGVSDAQASSLVRSIAEWAAESRIAVHQINLNGRRVYERRQYKQKF